MATRPSNLPQQLIDIEEKLAASATGGGKPLADGWAQRSGVGIRPPLPAGQVPVSPPAEVSKLGAFLGVEGKDQLGLPDWARGIRAPLHAAGMATGVIPGWNLIADGVGGVLEKSHEVIGGGPRGDEHAPERFTKFGIPMMRGSDAYASSTADTEALQAQVLAKANERAAQVPLSALGRSEPAVVADPVGRGENEVSSYRVTRGGMAPGMSAIQALRGAGQAEAAQGYANLAAGLPWDATPAGGSREVPTVTGGGDPSPGTTPSGPGSTKTKDTTTIDNTPGWSMTPSATAPASSGGPLSDIIARLRDSFAPEEDTRKPWQKALQGGSDAFMAAYGATSPFGKALASRYFGRQDKASREERQDKMDTRSGLTAEASLIGANERLMDAARDDELVDIQLPDGKGGTKTIQMPRGKVNPLDLESRFGPQAVADRELSRRAKEAQIASSEALTSERRRKGAREADLEEITRKTAEANLDRLKAEARRAKALADAGRLSPMDKAMVDNWAELLASGEYDETDPGHKRMEKEIERISAGSGGGGKYGGYSAALDALDPGNVAAAVIGKTE